MIVKEDDRENIIKSTGVKKNKAIRDRYYKYCQCYPYYLSEINNSVTLESKEKEEEEKDFWEEIAYKQYDEYGREKEKVTYRKAFKRLFIKIIVLFILIFLSVFLYRCHENRLAEHTAEAKWYRDNGYKIVTVDVDDDTYYGAIKSSEYAKWLNSDSGVINIIDTSKEKDKYKWTLKNRNIENISVNNDKTPSNMWW